MNYFPPEYLQTFAYRPVAPNSWYNRIDSRLFGLLLVLAGLAGLTILAFPYLPSLTFGVREETFGQQLQTEVEEFKAPVPVEQIMKDNEAAFASPMFLASFDNRLQIPRIDVDVALVEGENWRAMENGAWRLPGSATPVSKEGNVVISGHRFAFFGRNRKTFYYLDKLKVGDEVKISWQGKDYYYLVKGSRVVWPDQEEVLSQTRERKITLITCTPIGTANQRIVVEAIPIEVTQRTAKVL